MTIKSSKDICWCGTPVWKHIQDAEAIEASHGKIPIYTRRERPRKPIIDLDSDDTGE